MLLVYEMEEAEGGYRVLGELRMHWNMWFVGPGAR